MKNALTLQKMFLAAALLTQLTACVPPLYYPNGINAPLLSKKGQYTMNVGTDGSCTDVQLAASTSDKIGVIVNANYGKFSGNTSSDASSNGAYGNNSLYSENSYGHKHSFYEGGIGFYNKLGRLGRTETFLLAGYGNAISYGGGSVNTGNYSRFAIQSDIGIETNVFEGIFSCRAGYLDLNAHHSGETNEFDNNTNMDPSSFFIDPAITLRLGYKGFKLFGQYGLSIPLNGNNNQWNPGWCTLGIQMRIQ